jgi:hypothetical protein
MLMKDDMKNIIEVARQGPEVDASGMGLSQEELEMQMKMMNMYSTQ